MFMNANFDPKSLDKPVQYIPDKSLYQQVLKGFQKKLKIPLKRQTAILSDGILFEQQQVKKFYQVREIFNDMNRYNSEKGILITYQFVSSDSNTIFQRAVFNVFDALSRIGGVFAALRSGGLVFTALFSYKLLMSSLIGKLFYFRPKFASEVKK
jgi:hypothetical protein